MSGRGERQRINTASPSRRHIRLRPRADEAGAGFMNQNRQLRFAWIALTLALSANWPK
jgi:hypothetical protein